MSRWLQLTPGQRWTSALAVALAILLLVFGTPAKRATTPARVPSGPVVGADGSPAPLSTGTAGRDRPVPPGASPQPQVDRTDGFGQLGSGPQPILNWASLVNPVVDRPDRMQKDQAVVVRDGVFHVFASSRFADEPAEGSPEFVRRVSFLQSGDLRTYTTFADEDLRAASSPDVIAVDDTYYMVFQSPLGSVSQLWWSTSRDLVTWAPSRELLPGVFPGERIIDGALAFESGRFYVGFKRGQNLHVTRSQGASLESDWEPPLAANAGCGFAENYQFLELDGRWRMVATGREPSAYGPENAEYNEYTDNHEPFIFEMPPSASGQELVDWTRWVGRRRLVVPQETWNSVMHANSAQLVDERATDGWYYLFYAGSADKTAFQRRSHGKIGVVRSRNLVDWVLPGDLRAGSNDPEPRPPVDPYDAIAPADPACNQTSAVGVI